MSRFLAGLLVWLFLHPLLLQSQPAGIQVNLRVPGTVLASLTSGKIQSAIETTQVPGLTIRSVTTNWEAGGLQLKSGLKYVKDTGFFGLTVTLTGEVTADWQPTTDGSAVVLKRTGLRFRSDDQQAGILDGLVTSLMDAQLPKSFQYPMVEIEKMLTARLEKARLPYGRLTGASIRMTGLESDTEGLLTSFTVTGGLLAGKRPADTTGTWLSLSPDSLAAWLPGLINRGKSLRSGPYSVRFDEEAWKVSSRVKIPFKWFWLIPDELDRTVELTVKPVIRDDSLVLSDREVVVFDRKPGEWSLTNWMIRGQVEKAVADWEYPLERLPNRHEVTIGGLQATITLNQLRADSLEWSGEQAVFRFTADLKVEFSGEPIR